VPAGQKDWPVSVPAGIQAVAAFRVDLQHFDLHRVQDRIVFYAWWERRLHQDYPEIEWRLGEKDLAFLRTYGVARFIDEGGTGLSFALQGNWPTVLDLMPGFHEHGREAVIDIEAFTNRLPKPLQLVWGDRPDLQRAHDIRNIGGRVGFLQWWFNFGHLEHRRIAWRVDPALLEIDLHGEGAWPWPRFLSLIVAGRTDLDRSSFDPVSSKNWLNGLVWWHCRGFSEFAVPAWSLMNHIRFRSSLRRQWAASRAGLLDGCGGAGNIPCAAQMVWLIRADLQQAFDLRVEAGGAQLLSWWQAHGQADYGNLTGLLEDPSEELPGLNIVGYARSVMGLAEDVRMAVRSAQLANAPFTVIEAPMPGPPALDKSLDAEIASRVRRPVSLYCLPPTEMIRLGMEGGRQLLNSGTYNIGAWPWELPVWPDRFMGVIESVDEIWVFSHFVRNAFAEKTAKPLRHMPLAVELPAHPPANRAQFGIPAHRFHFLVMFDGNSWLSRKNPIAAVQAFKRAFGAERRVGLVIKSINLDQQSDAWRSVEAEIQGDDRVVVIDQTMGRVEVTQLMASCDAYVSLHRSEGFGRIIAEAMLLGLPTVTTNFSGNTDFCTPDTSFLVDGPRVALTKGDYMLYEGQYWCDPDVVQASEQMRRIVDQRDEAKGVAQAARHNIQTHYSAQAVAAAYRGRLMELRSARLV
jgi:glycosyltransferase involved in cell wall biosynthesis